MLKRFARRGGHADAEPTSALYAGVVMHQRLAPARHRLSYRMFSLFVDLDELPALDRRLRLFSLNRFNLFSLHERDHGVQPASGPVPAGEAAAGSRLRVRVQRELAQAGLPCAGPIRLLTMPRILGYAFNPLSVYFCHDEAGALKAILYEVNNTFGERHSYLIGVDPGQRDAGRVEQGCAKRMHVSPFLPMQMDYRFVVEPPCAATDTMRLGVTVHERAGDAADAHAATATAPAAGAAVLHARFDARRIALGDAALARLFFTHPLLTLKVVAAIHWEALRLVLKGVRVWRKPQAPAAAISTVKLQDT